MNRVCVCTLADCPIDQHEQSIHATRAYIDSPRIKKIELNEIIHNFKKREKKIIRYGRHSVLNNKYFVENI